MSRDYTYIVARLRALEAEMPDTAWFQRLVRTPVGGLVSMAREYFPGFEQVESAAGFEAGLEEERTLFMVFLTKLLGDGETVLFLRSGYDFDNLLHAWKAAKLGRATALTGAGLVDPELILEAVESDDPGMLPDHIGMLLERLGQHLEKADLSSAQYAGEALKYRFLLGIAPGEAASAYMRRKIDLANVVTLVRLKRSSLRATDPERSLIEGGMVDRDRIAALLKEPEEELYSFLRFSDYRGLLRFGLDQEAELWRISAASRSFQLDALGESRLSFFDISPLLYHLELRGRNEHIMRTVTVGKTNGIPEDTILERVEATLVS
jgi:hypothetical protein